jgi:uncharacterized protein
MHGLLPGERTAAQPAGPYGHARAWERGAAEPVEAAGARSFPLESGCDPARLGYGGEPAARGGASAVRDAGPRVDAAVAGDGCSCSAGSAAAQSGRRHRQTFLKTFVLALIGFYRRAISPVLPSSCRFYPTCSAYAYEAVSKRGVRRGLGLALRRFARCRPFGGFGFDPVPDDE